MAKQPQSASSTPPKVGRSWWATHDAETAHGWTPWSGERFNLKKMIPWLSSASQLLTGFDPIALINASKEANAHRARANAEFKNGEFMNAAISLTQAEVTLTQAATATPLGHHIVKITGAGDAIWYAGKKTNLELQQKKKKVKTE